MISKTNLVLLSLALGLAAAFLLTVGIARHYSGMCDRLAANQSALLDSLGVYRTSDGLRAVEVRRLTLTGNELRKSNARLMERINALGVKRRDVQAVQTVGTEYRVTFVPETVKIYDTLLGITPTTPTALRYSDRWLSFQYDTAAHVSMRDTITIVHHAHQRRFLWWTWSKYTGRATAVSSCPYAHIESVNAIDIQK